MDKEWLAAQLEAGRSLEDIAREVGRHASTVGYWVDKHGLRPVHAQVHRSRGGIAVEVLEPLVQDGRTHRQIAAELGVSTATVRHWLRRYGLKTRGVRRRGEYAESVLRTCSVHGEVEFVRYRPGDDLRCVRCRKERVVRRRREVKAVLVAEAGGRCALCGYDRYIGALHFHHRDPAEKRFALSAAGVARSLASCRTEAAKCVLLCANCHAEVEGGVATLSDA